MKQAEAGFKSAEAALRQSEAGSKSAEAALKQSEAGAKSAEAALKQSDIAWRGQLADRFIKTAPLLGKDEIKERLGALISLEEIAKHSDEHRWSIIELIAAYVRESITVGMKPGEGAGGTLGTAQTDIAMALDIIGRLNEPEKTLKRAVNLASCNLTKYYLKGNYSHTSFNYCVFEETTFFKCQLEAASFSQINLKSLAFSRCVGPIQGDTQNLIEINNLLDGKSSFQVKPGDVRKNPDIERLMTASSGNVTLSSASAAIWNRKQ